MELSGGEILVQCLKDEGVEYLFGYPGGAVLHIYDALYNQEKVKHILVRHEQAATHAADGYARATNKPGVVLVTSGPGATNAVTGIATAYMDSIPMVVITGQVATANIGSDAFQEVDSVGITRPCVKHNFLVKDINDLAETFKKAFYVATTGRPGPVVVDVPKDITDPNIKIPYHYPETVEMRSYQPTLKGHTGHTLGACGALESWAAVQMMNEGWCAPTLNLQQPDERCGALNYVMAATRPLDTDIVVNNNFAFGGINTSLVFRRWA